TRDVLEGGDRELNGFAKGEFRRANSCSSGGIGNNQHCVIRSHESAWKDAGLSKKPLGELGGEGRGCKQMRQVHARQLKELSDLIGKFRRRKISYPPERAQCMSRLGLVPEAQKISGNGLLASQMEGKLAPITDRGRRSRWKGRRAFRCFDDGRT